MSDTERRYDVELFPYGMLNLELQTEDDLEGTPEASVNQHLRPVTYSLDVIHRLIERLQEL
jgi:hypothetical protein